MQALLTDRGRWPWLALALAAVPAAMWWQPWADAPAVPAPAPAPVATKQMPVADAHPLAPAPTPAATPVAVHMPALTLVGTTVGGASSFATVRRTPASQPLLLRVGDRIDGLTVTAVEPDRIVLAGAAQPPIVIEIDRTAAASAPPAPARPVSPSRPASQAEQPAFAEGEAPWDAGPNFRH
jgi:hypothetical protein